MQTKIQSIRNFPAHNIPVLNVTSVHRDERKGKKKESKKQKSTKTSSLTTLKREEKGKREKLINKHIIHLDKRRVGIKGNKEKIL